MNFAEKVKLGVIIKKVHRRSKKINPTVTLQDTIEFVKEIKGIKK